MESNDDEMQYETLWHAAKHIRTVKSEFDMLSFSK